MCDKYGSSRGHGPTASQTLCRLFFFFDFFWQTNKYHRENNTSQVAVWTGLVYEIGLIQKRFVSCPCARETPAAVTPRRLRIARTFGRARRGCKGAGREGLVFPGRRGAADRSGGEGERNGTICMHAYSEDRVWAPAVTASAREAKAAVAGAQVVDLVKIVSATGALKVYNTATPAPKESLFFFFLTFCQRWR